MTETTEDPARGRVQIDRLRAKRGYLPVDPVEGFLDPTPAGKSPHPHIVLLGSV